MAGIRRLDPLILTIHIELLTLYLESFAKGLKKTFIIAYKQTSLLEVSISEHLVLTNLLRVHVPRPSI